MTETKTTTANLRTLTVCSALRDGLTLTGGSFVRGTDTEIIVNAAGDHDRVRAILTAFGWTFTEQARPNRSRDFIIPAAAFPAS